MSRIFLVDDPDILGMLRRSGLSAYALSDPGQVDLRTGEVIVVSAADAKRKAIDLIARGIADHRLSYVDTTDDFEPRAVPELCRHLYWDDVRPLSGFAEGGDEGRTFPSGFGFLDKNLKFRWRLPELCICAGPYGSGKSLLAQLLAMQFAIGEGRGLGSGAMLCAWEDLASEVKLGAQIFQRSTQPEHADILHRVHFVRRQAEEDRLISWYMDLVRYHRTRYGTRFFVLDPWNELDHVKNVNQPETEYIRDMMKQFRRLVDKLQIVLIIVTHVPARVIRGNGEIEPFKLAHAFGSVQFANKADRGICVVRTKKFAQGGHMIIRQDKAKVERIMGEKGTVAARYDPSRHCLDYDGMVTTEVQDIWKD